MGQVALRASLTTVSLAIIEKSLIQLALTDGRFARHPIFLYLVFDVSQRRQSALGNALLVKRSHWRKVQEQLKELTAERLGKAASDLRDCHRTSDALVLDLLRFIEGIGLPVAGSFIRKLSMRREMKGMILRFGMPAFWFTLNLSDLRHPLVMRLTGIERSDMMSDDDSDDIWVIAAW